MDREDQPKCKCRDCGKEFRKGDEGDNENYCLRCERLAILAFDHDEFLGED
jgi:DNA-directed RNA polymerase subunit RPC12/RpoP